MSRLRIGFLGTPQPSVGDLSRPVDVVFLQDVISRNADIHWPQAPYAEAADPLKNTPPTWTRRKPMQRGDTRTTVYLVSPHQPEWGLLYLNALYGATRDAPEPVRHYLPARVVDFGHPDTRPVFEQTHTLGDWV
jgi:hypothetical protein